MPGKTSDLPGNEHDGDSNRAALGQNDDRATLPRAARQQRAPRRPSTYSDVVSTKRLTSHSGTNRVPIVLRT